MTRTAIAWLTCLTVCGVALPAFPAYAEDYKLGEIYLVQMTGCVSKDIADIVVGQAKAEGNGLPTYQIAVAYGVCGRTVGQTRFTEVYLPFTNLGNPNWYVKYEVQLQDGSWKPFWGFTRLNLGEPTSELSEEVNPVVFECNSLEKIMALKRHGIDCI